MVSIGVLEIRHGKEIDIRILLGPTLIASDLVRTRRGVAGVKTDTNRYLAPP